MDNTNEDNSEMDNSSFLDMMNMGSSDINWVGTQDCSPIGEQAKVPTQTVSASAKPRSRKGASTKGATIKGKNWSSAEDKVLIQAWANTSLDAVTGTDQNSSSYWGRISAYYDAHKEPSWPERNSNGLTCRYNVISALTSKFCGCVQQIINRNGSGMTLVDKERDAHLMYIALDPKSKPFTLMHCYLEFEQHPKWQTQKNSQKKQKKTPEASPGTTSTDEDFGVCTDGLEEEKRPLGDKNEKKERLRKGWQPGIQEAAAVWDEEWDVFADDGFSIIKELTVEVEPPPVQESHPAVDDGKVSSNGASTEKEDNRLK